MAVKEDPKSKSLKKIPVKDIKATKGMTVDDMLVQMGKAGGFTAQKLADATDIVEKMVKKEGVLKILSFPACIMATGTRGVIVDMVKNHMVDVIITTCGCLDHDLSRLFAAYYKGDFMMDDKMLREHDVSRLGNVLVPDDCYGLVLEDNLLPMFDEIFGMPDDNGDKWDAEFKAAEQQERKLKSELAAAKNKGDDNVRGHIGTELNNKAETILQVSRNERNYEITEVKATMIRDKVFAPFAFKISDDGIPVLVDKFEVSQSGKKTPFYPELMAGDLHRKALDVAFLKGLEVNNKKVEGDSATNAEIATETETEAMAKINSEIDFDSITADDLETEPIKYTALLSRLQCGYLALGITRERNSLINLLKFLQKNDMIRKKGMGYVYNRDFHYEPTTEF